MYVLQKFIVCWIVYPGRINLCFAVICHLCISCYQLGECTDYPKQIIYLFTGQARDPPLPSPLLAHPLPPSSSLASLFTTSPTCLFIAYLLNSAGFTSTNLSLSAQPSPHSPPPLLNPSSTHLFLLNLHPHAPGLPLVYGGG